MSLTPLVLLELLDGAGPVDAPAAPPYRKLVTPTVITRLTDLAAWLALILPGRSLA